MTHYPTIVIGGGQAGLASAYHLRQAGSRFVVLDDGNEIGESWLRRWDSLRLFTPVRYSSLPGLAFPGDAYALPTKNDVANYFKKYASAFSLPVQLNSRVTSLDSAGRAYEVRTSGSTLTADTVIVATGAYHRPFVPELARGLHPEIIQVHSSAYRNPAQLPAGDVLVVGAGNSGAQIAIELNASGGEYGCRVVTPDRFRGVFSAAISTTGSGGRSCAHRSNRAWAVA
jgi:putative flavoprotein involved in K+ transport